MATNFDLTGKRALITGGRSGIGFAIACAFRDHGARVMVTGVRDDSVPDDTALAEGFEVRRLDVRDAEAIADLVHDLPRLDILVNNAGISIRFEKSYEIAAFADVLDVNLTGVLRLCNAFLPQLKESSGNIINIASLSSMIGSPLNVGYGASKAGLTQLTKSLSLAWVRYGIRVNAIAPGFVRTKLNQVLQDDVEFDAYVERRTPMARWGAPEEIAGGAVYLASSAASYTTGTMLVIDGGAMAA